jgi:hypothetical protein
LRLGITVLRKKWSASSTNGTRYAYPSLATISSRCFGYFARFGCSRMSSRPPASIATTICSKETPRSSLSCSFFSGDQRKGFTAAGV